MHRTVQLALLALTLPLALATPSQAHAEAGAIEIGFAPQILVLSDDSMKPLLAEGAQGTLTGTIRLAYGVDDIVDVHVGYRRMMFVSRAPSGGVSWDVEMQGALLGARVAWPIVSDWLSVYGLVDVEALHLDAGVDLGDGRAGSQQVWSFGVTPEVGLEVRWQMFSRFAAIVRLGAGYALRMDHDVDAVPIPVEGARATPLDLGAANASGWVFGTTFAFRW